MKFTELKDSLKAGAKSVYLLQGEDAYFRTKGEEIIKAEFLQTPELNFSSYDGEELKGAALKPFVAALKSYPFMAEKRIIKVSEFYPSESDFETYLSPIFEDFPPTCILIISNSSQGKKGADLKRKKAVAFVDCGKAEPESVARWVYITFKRAGLACSAETSENLAAYCLYDMSRVAVEVEKLIDYKQSGTVTKEDVDALVYKDADYRIYEMTNAVSRRDFTKYCAVSADLKSKGFDEISILNGLFSYFRNLLASLTSPLTDAQLARELDMKEYAVKKNREQAALIGGEKLKSLIIRVYSAIADVKNGFVLPSAALQICENAIFFGDN